MTDVTQILNAIQHGDPSASDKLLPLVYEELRVLARQRLTNEKPGQTLQATALVHEAYLRLVGDDKEPSWDNRGHFFAAAAEAMRRILVEAARRKKRLRHGGDLQRQEAVIDNLPSPYRVDEVLELHEHLTRLSVTHPQVVRLVEMKYFAGFTLEEIAEQMNYNVRTAQRHWAYAKAWLKKAMAEATESPTH
jgi:RNA polymerase sigma factor (TIGR02999 family)